MFLRASVSNLREAISFLPFLANSYLIPSVTTEARWNVRLSQYTLNRVTISDLRTGTHYGSVASPQNAIRPLN